MCKRFGHIGLFSLAVIALFSASLDAKSSEKKLAAQVALRKVQDASKIAVAWDIHKTLCTEQGKHGWDCRPKEDVFALVKKLHENGIKQVILSNISQDSYAKLFAQYPMHFKYFDPSGSLADAQGIFTRKPHGKYFEKFLAKNTDISPSNIIFFDDKSKNIEGARKKCISAYIFCNAGDTEHILKRKGLL